MSEWQTLTKHENSYKIHKNCPYFPKNFTKNIHLCMASLGYRVKGGYEQCTDIHHVNRYSVWIHKKTLCFSRYFLCNGSNTDTDMFRHININ